MNFPLRSLAIASVVAVAALGLLLGGSGFMVMMPSFLLLLPLLAGRYLGEGKICRLVRARSVKRILAAKSRPAAQHLMGHRLPARGGRLIAASLAVRPPPFPA